MGFTRSIEGDALLLAILGLMAGHTLWLWQQRRWLLLDPLNAFWGGVLVCYVQQPLLGGDIFQAWHGPGIFEKTLLATLVGLSCVALGYELPVGPAVAHRIPAVPARLDEARLGAAAWFLMSVGLMTYYFVIERSGGLGPFLSAGRTYVDFERVQGYWPELAAGLQAGAVLLLFRAYFFRVSLPVRVVAWSVVGLVVLWYIYIGTRSRTIMMVLVMLSAYYLPKRRNPPLVVAASLFLALSILVPFLGYRENFTNLSFNLERLDLEEVRQTVLPEFLGGSRSIKREAVTPGSEFNCAMAVVELVPGHVPYNYGYGHLELFTRWIPKAVWPEKRYPHLESVQGVMREGELSSMAMPTTGGQDLLAGPAFGFTGHWYYVGGFLGMVIGGLVTGILLRIIRAWYDGAPQNLTVLMIYPFLVPIGFMDAAATPGYWVFNQPFYVLPFLLVAYLCRVAVARPASGSVWSELGGSARGTTPDEP